MNEDKPQTDDIATATDASAATGAEPSRWQRVAEWFRPPREPTPLRFRESSEILRNRLGSPKTEVTDELLLEALAAFDEVADRAESADRRAATIQGSVAIAASLTLAGGSLLLDQSKLSSHSWRIALGAGFALAVALLAIAAWRAFLVTRPNFMWASPAATDIVEHGKETAVAAVRVRRISDLLVAYGRNDSIARLKMQLLGQAVRWLLAALVLLTIVAFMLAGYAMQRSEAQTAGENQVGAPTDSTGPGKRQTTPTATPKQTTPPTPTATKAP